MRREVLLLVSVMSGCCFTPPPPTPILPPPAGSAVLGGGPRLPEEVAGQVVELRPDSPDPLIFQGVAGGPDDALRFGPLCRGRISSSPNLRFRVSEAQQVRVMARGDADLTLVVRGPMGVLCNDDSDGLNPMVEGSLGPGVYDVHVGLYSAGAPVVYDLGLSRNAALTPTTMRTAGPAQAVGATLRSGVLTVTSAAGAVASAGDVCTYSESSVVAQNPALDVRWNITCGTRVLYGAGTGGYGRSTDPTWPPGTVAYDLETTAVDTDPAFEWTATGVRLRDDETGAEGAFDLSFRLP
ncbi:MAG: hypothetical protein ACK6CU_25860 [Deltaproteobacteria bacterium]|jgi:hypothetical protein